MKPGNKNRKHEQILCDELSLSAFTHLQSYGVLLVLDRRSLRIIQYSENVESQLKTPASRFRDKLITDFLTFRHPNGDVRTWLMQSDKRYAEFIWNEGHNPQLILSYVHQQNDIIILEIELIDNKNLNEQVFSLINDVVNIDLDESSQDTAIIAKLMCDHIRRITGYDRVVLYQFQEDNTGIVLGESIKKGMDSFLGFHFPDTDIPYYVREMYLQQPLRYVPDIDYTPIALLSSPNAKKTHVVDLSNVMLRAVSPIHVEYLHNMGVSSTLSVAIIYNDKLWGLIACHHNTAKNVSLYYRFALILLAKLIIRKLLKVDTRIQYIAQNLISKMLLNIQNIINNAKNLFLLFENIKNDVTTMLSSDGIAFFYADKLIGGGSIPNEKQIRDLIDWLVEQHPSQPFITHNLLLEYPLSKEYYKLASGLLALPLTPNEKNYLLVFRKEVMIDIVWGGDPSNVLTLKGDKYSPRNSFKMWKEIVKNKSKRWKPYEIEAAKSLQIRILSKSLEFLFDEREKQYKHFEIMQQMRVKLEREVSIRTEELNISNERLREAVKQLHMIKDSFIKKEKMAIIGQLAAGIAHEINNPLAFLISNIEYLQKQNINSAPIKDLDTILSESKVGLMRIKNIVSNLVVFSNSESVNHELVDVNSALKSAIELTRNEWKYNAKIIENFSEIPKVLGSLNQLEMVFVNFILNAAQSISINGEISISTSVSGSSILISFEDNGCGISEAHISKLFTPFFTTKPKNDSLGLGLAVNYGIVESLGGNITVESEPGCGSTFTVYLPIDSKKAL